MVVTENLLETAALGDASTDLSVFCLKMACVRHWEYHRHQCHIQVPRESYMLMRIA